MPCGRKKLGCGITDFLKSPPLDLACGMEMAEKTYIFFTEVENTHKS
jgi:hypothetical protein